MKHRMNRQMIWVALLGVALVSTPAYAFEGWGENGKDGKGKFHQKREAMMKKMTADLGLTEAQQKQIEDQHASMKQRQEEIFKGIETKRSELRAELDKPELDRARIDQLTNELSAFSAQKVKNRVEGILEIRTILTPEQFKQLHQKMEEKREAFKAKWKNHGRKHHQEEQETEQPSN
ncbi:MAG: periplasmic heavy metal sensor [Candidatus Omnitrophica bacterium]|nr:periplasmic heavy metal sensor [Candidatus Omnitrophota bacterium]MDD5671036.1 periplasmic heavy metal sensor [Candidatus Omnitrophota bacterium]